ncbi:MAG: polymer-forming cytoskeletal protein [Bacteroidales bacterium]|nr:polymer-forming cytoskeletal protein [Bacteroidales bacterium]MBR1949848.1 polymer-forming cytoskeletal protein [Bacteroidales bacterium]MBR4088345.1 polymer-forming cytoskeletal protein [Bacteroidales bacterium]
MARHEQPQINEVSRISSGTEVRGSLVSRSDIRVDGVFEGDLITSGKLVVGENAVIRGNVMCANADIWGKMEGELTVGDAVSFKASSSFAGNLKTIRICIEMGAEYSGSCLIINEAEFKTISAEYFH